MAKYKITLDRPECIGCGTCEALCPDFWEMGEDGQTTLKGSKQEGDSFILEVDDLGCNMEAAESCPVNCIHIEENGKSLI